MFRTLLLAGWISALVVSLFVLETPCTAQQSSIFHTRSIVACDPSSDQCGIAVVSFPTGVPAFVPVGEPGVIVANQSVPRYATARAIIEAVGNGADAETALLAGLATDPSPSQRQIGVAALSPRSETGVTVASYTGGNAFPETCSRLGATYAVQANLQTSTGVCDAIADAFESGRGSLPRRLLSALRAGTSVGNDLREEFSASIRVFSASGALAETTPISAEAAVIRAADWESELEFGLNAYLSFLVPADQADRVELTTERGAGIQRVLQELAFYQGPTDGVWTDTTETALLAFGAMNSAYPRATEVIDGTRLIDAPYSDYIIAGAARGVLKPAPPDIEVSPRRLNFGDVTVGQTAELTFNVRNSGHDRLMITNITNNNDQFSVAPLQVPFTLRSGEQQTVTVRFSPTMEGTQLGLLQIKSNDLDELVTGVTIRGRGI